jgi:hypothetical protein
MAMNLHSTTSLPSLLIGTRSPPAQMVTSMMSLWPLLLLPPVTLTLFDTMKPCVMLTPLNGGSPCTKKSLHSSNKELGKLSQNLQQQLKSYLALELFAVNITQTDASNH